MDQVTKIALGVPGVDQVIAISGISVLDNSATLANAGVAYVILKDWSVRKPGSGADLRSVYANLQGALDKLQDGVALVLVPPPIQGIGNASGFTMQVELRDGSFDYAKLQTITQTDRAGRQHADRAAAAQLRRSAPACRRCAWSVDRVKAETLNVAVGDVFNVLAGYIGSSYVNQFNKFGRTFQVYVQADSQYRLLPTDIENLYVRSQDGKMVPLGALVDDTADGRAFADQPLQPLSDGEHRGRSGAGLQLRRGDGPDGADRRHDLAAAARGSNGRRCPTRRSSSATRSCMCSAWPCCWSICAWPASTRAGSRRYR